MDEAAQPQSTGSIHTSCRFWKAGVPCWLPGFLASCATRCHVIQPELKKAASLLGSRPKPTNYQL